MLSCTNPTLKILDIIENRTDCKGAANGEEEPVEYSVMKKLENHFIEEGEVSDIPCHFEERRLEN